MRKTSPSTNPQKSATPRCHTTRGVGDWMKDAAFRQAVLRIERDELALLDALLTARNASGLTQAQIAERLGTKPPAVSRLLASLASDK